MKYSELKDELTDHDRELMRQADEIDNYIFWWKIDESKADSKPGWNYLHNLSVRMYHMEEASIGNL